MADNSQSRPLLARWFAPPVFSSGARTQQAHSVHYVVLAMYFVATALLSTLIVLEPATISRRGITILMLTGLTLVILTVNRLWSPRVAGIILVAGLLLLITERNYSSGGLRAPAAGMYVVIVLIAGLVFGARGGIVFAVLVAIAGLGLAIVEINGELPPSELEYKPLTIWIYTCLWVGFALIIQYHVSRSLRRLLQRAEDELAERNRAQQRLDLSLAAGRIGVWELDPASDRIACDDFTCDLFDVSPDEHGGISRALMRDRIHPEDREQAIEVTQQLLKGARIGHSIFRVVRTDGSIRYVDGTMSLVDSPELGGQRIVGINVDVTERELAAKERASALYDLGERVKELRLLHTTARMLQGERKLDSALLQQLVSLMPPAWQFPEVCEARIRFGELSAQTPGWKDSEWVQSAQFDTNHGELRIDVAYVEARPPAAEGPFLEEERALLRSFGEMLVSYIELREYQEGLEQLVETRTQELKTSYERLQNLEKLRDDLVHMIVHDMRSPLTALMMSLDLLKKKFGSDLAMPMESALRTTNMLNLMANNLLDVSRLEEGKMPLRRSNVDVGELAGQVVTALQMLDHSRNIELASDQPAPASCDRGLIRRVLENLVSNGFKHTPAGTTLRIVVTPSPGKVRVEVIDQGEGVPKEARERIFEKFGAVAAKRDQTYHSAGLGLAFCKLAMDAHGGEIGVDDAAGGGSNFWIELPDGTESV